MAQLMTMRDIAGLARVQRPVVSIWRRRSRATAHPFPQPQHDQDGRQLFSSDDVVAWLEETQRGNNPDARVEAAAHTLLSSAEGTPAVYALSALLVLRHLTGGPLADQTADDLLDRADSLDPDDQYLLRELEHASQLPALARAADELVEAAWGEAAAHQRLVAERLRLPGTPLAQTGLAAQARLLLTALLAPLCRDLGDTARVMDATGCAVDVLAAVAAAVEASVVLLHGDTPLHRLTRRQLLLADVPATFIDRGAADWSVSGLVAHLVVLPDPADPAAPPVAQLALLDEIALQLDDEQLVLCLAPASTLTDPLVGDALTARDQLLRAGHVRAIVRLPAGLLPARAREPLALWLLTAADGAPPAERRTLVADLSSSALSPTVIDDLASDLLAAWQGVRGARRRAWAHLRPVPTGSLISASASLVPDGGSRAKIPARSGADWVVGLRSADIDGWLAGYGLDVRDAAPAEVSLAQAIERGWVRVLSGQRVSLDGLPPGSVPVLGVAEVADAAEPRTVDRLALHTRLDPTLTEPGDLVFVVRPTPRAVLDAAGGSLFQFPARVLRLRRDAPLVPAAVVARINTATSTAWRTWRLAVVPQPDRDVLGEALTDLGSVRARLVEELARLDALATNLTTAVESRQLSITKERHGTTSG